MKYIILLLVFCLSFPCFASGIAKYPTVGAYIDRLESVGYGQSIDALYFSVDGSFPFTEKSEIVAGIKTGSNYGVMETITRIGIRFELHD